MWQRIQTAIILVIIVGVAMFASDTPYLFIPLLGLGVTIAAYEWTKMMPKWQPPALFVGLVLLITMLTLAFTFTWPMWWTASTLIWVMAIGWVGQYPNATDKWYGKRLAVIGLILLTAAISAMYYLWLQSPWHLLYVFLMVWCADSGAYFVGRKLGRHKMSPQVSPNKSMEGLAGGLITGLILVLGVSLWTLNLTGLQLLLFVMLSGMTILVSVLGDLLESMLKRRAQIKDSGTILPGHGGILDRIDSLLAATPIFALGYWVFHRLGWLTIS